MPFVYHLPCFFCFQFGGKLVSFGNEALQAGQTGVMYMVFVSQVVTEHELIADSNQLETALQHGQYSEFCEAKISSSTTPHERSVWNFLRASFQTNTRAELLSLLGFKSDEINNKVM
jgi:protein transport protein SEC31